MKHSLLYVHVVALLISTSWLYTQKEPQAMPAYLQKKGNRSPQQLFNIKTDDKNTDDKKSRSHVNMLTKLIIDETPVQVIEELLPKINQDDMLKCTTTEGGKTAAHIAIEFITPKNAAYSIEILGLLFEKYPKLFSARDNDNKKAIDYLPKELPVEMHDIFTRFFREMEKNPATIRNLVLFYKLIILLMQQQLKEVTAILENYGKDRNFYLNTLHDHNNIIYSIIRYINKDNFLTLLSYIQAILKLHPELIKDQRIILDDLLTKKANLTTDQRTLLEKALKLNGKTSLKAKR